MFGYGDVPSDRRRTFHADNLSGRLICASTRNAHTTEPSLSKPSVPRNPEFEHFRKPPTGLCWWCGAPATTREHKYKRTDLDAMGTDGQLMWGGDPERPYIVKSHRRDPAVRFVKSLCANCNNARSQPFDRAYDTYAQYVRDHLDSLWFEDGLGMRDIYGRHWRDRQRELACYFVKHFGCRLVEEGLTPPQQMADFLDGAPSMPNVHLAFMALEDRRALWELMTSDGFDGYGLFLGGLYTRAPRDKSRLQMVLSASYISYVGVRFEWNLESPVSAGSFFPYPRPLLNKFQHEEAAMFPDVYPAGRRD
jgi:hypothetical protein